MGLPFVLRLVLINTGRPMLFSGVPVAAPAPRLAPEEEAAVEDAALERC